MLNSVLEHQLPIAQAAVDQDAPQGGPAGVDAFAFAKQLLEMSMVGSLVNRASQVNHPAPDRLGNGVVGPAAPEAMGKGSGSFIPVIRQNAPVCRGLNPISAAVCSSVMCSAFRLFRTWSFDCSLGVKVTFTPWRM